MNHIGPTIKPALWNDHGRWQVTQDEICLFLPRLRHDWNGIYFEGQLGYWLCRLWCWRHGYGWLPVI